MSGSKSLFDDLPWWDESEHQRADLKKDLLRATEPQKSIGATHILALDMSAKKTGWSVVSKDGELVDSGVIKTGTRKRGVRLDYLQREFSGACERCGVSRDQVKVVYETPFTVYKKRSNPGFGYRCEAALWLWCRDYGATETGVAPMELKKWATGKGNAGKPMMIQAAQERWPHVEIIDDNHADALLLAAWGLENVEWHGDEEA